MKGKIYQGVFEFDTCVIGHCYLLSALTYIMNVMVILNRL
jgi:hypothetical protein